MIRVEQVTKRFGDVTAVNDVSFRIETGESVALWGPNGAGKTTLMRCLLGVLPFEGRVVVDGIEVPRRGREARRRVGFVPQELALYNDLSVEQTLDFFSRIRKAAPDEADALLERLDLSGYVEKTVGELSGGMKQRVALAVALLGNPPILLFDEPTSNLDIRAREDLLKLCLAFKEEGKTMLFSSHHLEEVMFVADRLIVLQEGRCLADCSVDGLEELIEGQAVVRIFLPENQVPAALEALRRGGFETQPHGRGVKVRTSAHRKSAPLEALFRAAIPVWDFSYTTEGWRLAPKGSRHD